MASEITGVARLTRWKEYFGTAVFVTALGLSLSSRENPLIWWKALMIIGANLLAFSFAFMINDIEDAEDDAMDPKKALRNPISAQILTPRRAYIYTLATAGASLLISAFLGKIVFLFCSVNLLLGFLYSWKVVRLKSLPVVDLLSHALFLGTLELLAAALISNQTPQLIFIIWIAITVFITSIIGDLDNELRDFDVDKKAKLINTAQLLKLKPLRPYLHHFQIVAVTSIFIYLFITFSLTRILILLGFVVLLLGVYYLVDYKKHKSFFYYRYTETLMLFTSALLLFP